MISHLYTKVESYCGVFFFRLQSLKLCLEGEGELRLMPPRRKTWEIKHPRPVLFNEIHMDISIDNCMKCGHWLSISSMIFTFFLDFLNPANNFVNGCYNIQEGCMFKWYWHVSKIYGTFAFILANLFCSNRRNSMWVFFFKYIFASVYLQSSMCAKF